MGDETDEGARLDHELTGGAAIDAVRVDGQTTYERAVNLMVQPSGYLRTFDVRLTLRGATAWVRWDPLIRRLILEEAS